jgi:nicotinamidase-related amidase
LLAPEFDRSALIMIDMQIDFADGGASPVAGTTDAVPVIAKLAVAYREARRPVLHVIRLYTGTDVDLPRRSAIAAGVQLVRPGTAGSQIVAELMPPGAPALDPALLLSGAPQFIREDEVVLWKPRWSAFHRTGMDAHLAGLGVSTLVFVGCNFPNCPRAAIYDASERDYKVVMVTRRHLRRRPPSRRRGPPDRSRPATRHGSAQ